MTNIKLKHSVGFNFLCVGEVFQHLTTIPSINVIPTELYMKIEPCILNETVVNAVNLNDGHLCHFADEDDVIVIEDVTIEI